MNIEKVVIGSQHFDIVCQKDKSAELHASAHKLSEVVRQLSPEGRDKVVDIVVAALILQSTQESLQEQLSHKDKLLTQLTEQLKDINQLLDNIIHHFT